MHISKTILGVFLLVLLLRGGEAYGQDRACGSGSCEPYCGLPDPGLRRRLVHRFAAALEEQAGLLAAQAANRGLLAQAILHFADESSRFREEAALSRPGSLALASSLGRLGSAADIVDRRLKPRGAADTALRDDWSEVRGTLEDLQFVLGDAWSVRRCAYTGP